MRQMKCPNCGGRFIPQPEGYYVCDSCGVISEGAGSDLSEDDIVDLDNANYRRDRYEFDEALELCQKVLQNNPLNAEANRCAILAKNKIVHLKNAKGEYTPTFLDPDTETPIPQSPYYRNLPERMKREMDKIEAIRQRVLRNAKNIPQYDVFISYKSGQEEAEWAKECYKMLAKQQEGKRYNVFYDEVSLGEKQAGWEPHIYSALKSAKCMILFASSIDNMNSVWVQNEWKRFIYLQKADPQKQIIVVGKNIDPYDLPDPALRDQQMLTVGKDQWQNNIKSRVREICDDSNISELLKNGDSYLLAGKFKRAKAVFKRILVLDSNCAQAYWGLLRCRLKAFDDYDIVKYKKKLENVDEFYKARSLAEAGKDDVLLQRIRKVQNAQIAKDSTGFDRANYEHYRKKTKGLRVFKRIMAVVCALAIVATGMFGYWEYSHPLKYSVENNQATLEGKSIFFNLLASDDLVVENYNDYPIVAIGDGAMRGSKVKTVKLAGSVTTIDAGAFAGSNGLTKVDCLSTTVTIGAGAFANCKSLSSVTFGADSAEPAARSAEPTYAPGGSVSIGEGAFENCIALESISLSGLTYLGADAFRGCSRLTSVYIDSGKNLRIDVGAFDSVPAALVVRIPTVEEDLYNSLVREYESVTFEMYTRDRVEEVVYFIDKIGDISIDSLPAIEKAEQLYGQLTADESGRVSNYADLRDARAIYAAVAAINRIGTVTLQNEDDIKAAEEIYGALNEMQKERVTNRESLTDARAVFNTMKRIAQIGSVSLQSKNAIEGAEAEYSVLTEKQKGMVSNYSVLRDARDTYDVYVTIDLINRIGTVNENSGSLIEQAERAYNALSPALYTRVTNYMTLLEARQIYNVIAAIAKLNVINLDSMSAINAAENLYYALTEDQQAKVTNSSTLEKARDIYSVVEAIAGIGQITLGSESMISQAEKALAALSVAEQDRVGNRNDLKDARAAFDVMQMIAAIGSVSSGNRSQIEAAKKAYDALTAAQRQKVGNYDVLESAVDSLRVMDVEEAINGIGQVTSSSRSAIEAAESAYQSLTPTQKEKVSNYDTLLEARHIYDVLVEIGNLGSVVVGSGKQYNYNTLTSASAPTLNQSSFRNAVDSISFTGIIGIREAVWTAAFPKLKLVRYDLTTANAPSSYTVPAGTLTYVLVGAVAKKYTMSISAQAGSAAHVGFDNFTLENGTLPIDLTNAVEGYISFFGTCNVTATTSGNGAIKARNCTITLDDATVTVRAANGTTSVNAGIGLEAQNLTIKSDYAGSLTVYGGNGADGTKGADGKKGAWGNVGTRGGIGTKGEDGTDGKNGGAAVIGKNIIIDVSMASVSFLGGTGGAGGVGGTGGAGGDGSNGTALHYRGTDGGNGGTGGSGGSGGSGGDAISNAESVDVLSGKLVLQGGAGGKGGAGGAGGNGGSGGTRWGLLDVNGAKGAGGAGGNGGSGGRGGDDCGCQVSTQNTAEVVCSDGAKGSTGSTGATGK